MTDLSHHEVDVLWDEFHRVVNMTSQELSTWLRTRDASPLTEPLPDQAGSEAGQHILSILAKRRRDLTDDDVRLMRKVVDRIHALSDEEREPEAADQSRRHRLMSLGHDPLKPS
ncbi:DUF3140 domain-containing protein [Streptomyces sp. HC44]|uniref:DUF3140 domain-containing protein n=1 Tax=Streptomyces scabichelini TaxID=2711217 RepID=A0A6G4V0J2_9ACTN|nr:DUF3140 domain-containing protein [Streptomyces scabichelini]NGO07403.1 DUF3140 domain-containing protein [Streptomyces scabichelini]